MAHLGRAAVGLALCGLGVFLAAHFPRGASLCVVGGGLVTSSLYGAIRDRPMLTRFKSMTTFEKAVGVLGLVLGFVAAVALTP